MMVAPPLLPRKDRRQGGQMILFAMFVLLMFTVFTFLHTNSVNNNAITDNDATGSRSFGKHPRQVIFSERLQPQQQQQQPHEKQQQQVSPNHFMVPARAYAGNEDDSLFSHLTGKALQGKFDDLCEQIRQYKSNLRKGVFMETQPEALAWTRELQDLARALIRSRYGRYKHYDVQLKVRYSPSFPTNDLRGTSAKITIRMDDIRKVPVAVFYFLEMARTFQDGSFKRNMAHILFARVESTAVTDALPFQEYHPSLPHEERTTGFSGRPGGPSWYVSVRDNTKGHGMGSQQTENPYEADIRFGRILHGYNSVILNIHEQVAVNKLLDEDHEIAIERMSIYVSDDDEDEEPKLLEF